MPQSGDAGALAAATQPPAPPLSLTPPHPPPRHAPTHPTQAGDADALAAATQPPGEDDPQPLAEEEAAEKERLLQVRLCVFGALVRIGGQLGMGG